VAALRIQGVVGLKRILREIAIVTAILALPTTAQAQVQPPLHTSGTVTVSLASGGMTGKICLAVRAYGFREAFALNAGLNVARVTDGAGKSVDFDGWYDPGVDGEARVYTLKTPSSTICIDYVGAFPVYPDHDAPLDFKGVVAFNGDSVRATEQSAWLPLPFDIKNKVRLNSTGYDLNINCADCAFIYVNGSNPVTRSSGNFVSKDARPAMLFAGKGPLTRSPNVTIVNEQLSKEETAALVNAYRRIETFYGDYLGRKIHDTPAIVRVVAINQAERDRSGSEWGFATWPTIAFSGSIHPIATALMKGGELGERRLGYLAHEIGHYYFGTVTDPSGPYHWFLVESTAEFLSLKARGALAGAPAEQRRIKTLANDIADERTPFKALNQITDGEQIGDEYRYNYGPLLLIALEQRVGERRMAAFMQALLTAPTIRNWQDLSAVADRAGIAKADWDAWRDQCVRDGTHACIVSASR
jgi:hypothetical protein